MVLGLEALGDEIPCSTNGLEDPEVVLATAGNALDDNVGDTADERRQLCFSVGGGDLQHLDEVGGGLGGSHQHGLLSALSRCDLFAERLLLCSERLELGDGRTTQLVRLQDLVDDPLVLAPGTLRSPHGVRLVSQELDVDHAPEPICGTVPSSNPLPVSYTHLRAHETVLDLVCRLL